MTKACNRTNSSVHAFSGVDRRWEAQLQRTLLELSISADRCQGRLKSGCMWLQNTLMTASIFCASAASPEVSRPSVLLAIHCGPGAGSEGGACASACCCSASWTAAALQRRWLPSLAQCWKADACLLHLHVDVRAH